MFLHPVKPKYEWIWKSPYNPANVCLFCYGKSGSKYNYREVPIESPKVCDGLTNIVSDYCAQLYESNAVTKAQYFTIETLNFVNASIWLSLINWV